MVVSRLPFVIAVGSLLHIDLSNHLDKGGELLFYIEGNSN